MGYLLGLDIGSSSVKASIVEAESGRCVASDHYPKSEAPIKALKPGWAEQNPEDWWSYTQKAFAGAVNMAQTESPRFSPTDIDAIGISWQMHGLVCVGKDLLPLRDAIIWCDSRAVPYGQEAFDALGHDYCLSHMLNSPGNFTAAKLAWVKDHEPEIFEKIHKIMLPGDYIALKLSGEATTTIEGLSEGMMWDFANKDVAYSLLDHYGFGHSLLPTLVPNFGMQVTVSSEAAALLGLKAGTPVTYRAGDQPNNALSLNVLEPGEIASTAGTSGVVYGVNDSLNCDPLSRVNTFAHVNYTTERPRLGVLLCINGTGILNSWLKHNVAANMDYAEMNALAAQVPVGCDGLTILPFGNGAERMLQNREIGCSIHGLSLTTHTKAHLMRAAQEGIVYSFRYGVDIMREMGMKIKTIKAGHANMFLSPIFAETLATVCEADIHLMDTDGAMGAARGAGIGAGIYRNSQEAFAGLNIIKEIHPDTSNLAAQQESYQRWKSILEQSIR